MKPPRCAVIFLMLAGCSSPPAPVGYETEQGTRLFGALQQGAWKAASFTLTGARAAGQPQQSVTVSVEQGALRVRGADGRALDVASASGLILSGTVSYFPEGFMEMSAPVLLRVEGAGPHRSTYGGPEQRCGQSSASETEYQLSIALTQGGGTPAFAPLCSGGRIFTRCPGVNAVQAAARAVPVPGRWTLGGYDPAAAGHVSFSCLDGVIVKCQDWGYKPAADPMLHQTCARMARADYHAVSVARTVDGTPIEIFDAKDQRAPLSAGYTFESGWRRAGLNQAAAVCLSKRRWSTLPLGGFRPDLLPDPRQQKGGRFCPEAPLSPSDLADLKALGAELFNNSAFIDAGLYRWSHPGMGLSLTTTRYVLATYDEATRQATSDPPELAQAGFLPAVIDTPADSLPRDRTGYEGGVFRHPVPAPWTLPERAVPLYTYAAGPAERPSDFLTTTLADLERDYPALGAVAAPNKSAYRRVNPSAPEGYIFAPLPLQQGAFAEAPVFRNFHSIPLYTWWDAQAQRHLTSADVTMNHKSCAPSMNAAECRPGAPHKTKPSYVFVRLEGYLLCLGCPAE